MVTLKDIAKRSGVSIDTVSRVLNGKTKETWASTARRAKRIREIAREMGYYPNAAARGLRTEQAVNVGISLHSDVMSRYEAELLGGVRDGLLGSRYALSLLTHSELTDGATGGLDRILRERVLAGMVVLHAHNPVLATEIKKRMLPCVWLDTNRRDSSHCLQRDEFHAGQVVARETLSAGYRRLLFVGLDTWPNCHHCVIDRRAGVVNVAEEAGVPLDVITISESNEGCGAHADELAEKLHRDTGVIAWNGELAEWISHTCGRLGKNPPRDFGLACCGDNRHISRVWPGLSRVTFDRRGMGVAAARMLIQMLETPSAHCPSVKQQGEWHPGNTLWTAREGTP